MTLDNTGSPTLKDSADALGRCSPRPGRSPSLCTLRTTLSWTPRLSPVSGNGTYSTPTGYTLPTTGTVTGTYQWVVSYSGDANNRPQCTSVLGDEPVMVDPASPTHHHDHQSDHVT